MVFRGGDIKVRGRCDARKIKQSLKGFIVDTNRVSLLSSSTVYERLHKVTDASYKDKVIKSVYVCLSTFIR